MPWMAAGGFALVALAQVMFFIMGGDRPSPYREVQALSVLATCAIVAGIWTDRVPAIVGGLTMNAILRALQPILGLTRLPIALNARLFLVWTLTAERIARRRDPQLGIWIRGAAHAMLTAIGRLSAAIALMLAAVGLLFAAPNMRADGPGPGPGNDDLRR